MVALASPSEIKSKAIHQITHHTRLLPTPLFKPLFHAPTYKCTPSLAMSQHSPTHITFFLTFLLYSMCVDSSWVLLDFILFEFCFPYSLARLLHQEVSIHTQTCGEYENSKARARE